MSRKNCIFFALLSVLWTFLEVHSVLDCEPLQVHQCSAGEYACECKPKPGLIVEENTSDRLFHYCSKSAACKVEDRPKECKRMSTIRATLQALKGFRKTIRSTKLDALKQDRTGKFA